MTKTTTYFDLRDACHLPGCPLCRMEQAAVQHALDGWMYEDVNDPGLREHLRSSLGFCHEHAWQVANEMLGNALGLAIIYNDVLGEALKRLDEHPTANKRPLSPHKTCPACEQRETIAHHGLSELVKYIDDDELRAALKDSDGLCLPHLGRALQHIKDPHVSKILLETQHEKIRRLRAELAEFIRKADYRFAGEGFGKERDSWVRAIGMAAGSASKGDRRPSQRDQGPDKSNPD